MCFRACARARESWRPWGNDMWADRPQVGQKTLWADKVTCVLFGLFAVGSTCGTPGESARGGCSEFRHKVRAQGSGLGDRLCSGADFGTRADLGRPDSARIGSGIGLHTAASSDPPSDQAKGQAFHPMRPRDLLSIPRGRAHLQSQLGSRSVGHAPRKPRVYRLPLRPRFLAARARAHGRPAAVGAGPPSIGSSAALTTPRPSSSPSRSPSAS